MKKLIAVAFVVSALVACGGKAKPAATMENKAGEMAPATGGATYGTAVANPCGAPANPCAPMPK